MLHILPDPEPRPQPYAEAVTRLASIRHALRLVEPFGAGPASDPANDDEAVAAAWERADEAKQQLFDQRSGRLVNAAAAGLEALVANGASHEEATQTMIEQIRRELAEVAGIVLA